MKFKFFPETVKNRILLVITIVLLILVFVPAILFYQSFMTSIVAEQIKAGNGVYKQVLRTLEHRSESMAMLSIAVANMPRVQEYMYLEDRGSLAQVTIPLFETLKKRFDINVFHFHEKPAISFLRLQNLKKYGDDLSSFRHSVVAANTEKKLILALERGRAGLSNRAVVPLFYENEHIGSVEFGLPIDNRILLDIKKQIGCDISLLIPDEKEGFKYQAKTHDLTIPERMKTFLSKMMKTDKIVTRQVKKNNKSLVTTYGPIKDFSGNIIALLAVPLDITDVLAAAKTTMFKIIGAGVAILVGAIAVVLLFFRSMVNRPINMFKEKLEKASSGDLTQEIKIGNASGENTGSKNEFVELGSYFNTLLSSIRKIVQEIDENSGQLSESSVRMGSVSDELSERAGNTVSRSANAAESTDEMSQNMNRISTSTENAADNIKRMTKSTEGISQSIHQIQKSTVKAKGISENAVNSAGDISEKMNELGMVANSIGKITDTIEDISKQTNLLALNATIEAARAGEAGKGFAVVAGEIKTLAMQTADATGEIAGQIEKIQTSSQNAAEGIGTITSIINDIDSIVSDIVSSLEEQGSTLSDLTVNIQQAGVGMGEVASSVAQSSSTSSEIAEDVGQVNKEAIELSKGSSCVQRSAQELKELSRDLRSMVSQFKLR